MLRIGSLVWGVRDVTRGIAFWTAALDYRVAQHHDDTWAILVPREGDGPQLALALAASDRPCRHPLDLHADDAGSEVERLLSIGATRVPWRYPNDAS